MGHPLQTSHRATKQTLRDAPGVAARTRINPYWIQPLAGCPEGKTKQHITGTHRGSEAHRPAGPAAPHCPRTNQELLEQFLQPPTLGGHGQAPGASVTCGSGGSSSAHNEPSKARTGNRRLTAAVRILPTDFPINKYKQGGSTARHRQFVSGEKTRHFP